MEMKCTPILLLRELPLNGRRVSLPNFLDPSDQTLAGNWGGIVLTPFAYLLLPSYFLACFGHDHHREHEKHLRTLKRSLFKTVF